MIWRMGTCLKTNWSQQRVSWGEKKKSCPTNRMSRHDKAAMTTISAPGESETRSKARIVYCLWCEAKNPLWRDSSPSSLAPLAGRWRADEGATDALLSLSRGKCEALTLTKRPRRRTARFLRRPKQPLPYLFFPRFALSSHKVLSSDRKVSFTFLINSESVLPKVLPGPPKIRRVALQKTKSWQRTHFKIWTLTLLSMMVCLYHQTLSD